jgi:hypothetical protein
MSSAIVMEKSANGRKQAQAPAETGRRQIADVASVVLEMEFPGFGGQ